MRGVALADAAREPRFHAFEYSLDKVGRKPCVTRTAMRCCSIEIEDSRAARLGQTSLWRRPRAAVEPREIGVSPRLNERSRLEAEDLPRRLIAAAARVVEGFEKARRVAPIYASVHVDSARVAA